MSDIPENIENIDNTEDTVSIKSTSGTSLAAAPEPEKQGTGGRLSRLRFIDSLSLKLMAMALMFCDHAWLTVAYGHEWLSVIGRLAFPIFAFQIVEGFYHTRSRKKYLLRMFIFALVSEIPFNYLVSGGPVYPFHQNVMFTFCISILAMMLLEKARERAWWVFLIVVILVTPAAYLIGFITLVDYYGYGVLMVLVFYLFHDVKFGWIAEIAAMFYINWEMIGGLVFNVVLFGHTVEIPKQGFAVLAMIPILLYNGKPGCRNRAVKYAGYIFYPAHMVFLVLLSYLLFW